MKNNFLRNLGMYLVIFLFIIGMILVNKNFSSSTPQTTDYVYSDMISQINGDKVESITLQRDADVSDSGTAVVNLKDGKSYKVTISSVSSFVDTVNPAVEKGLKLTTQAPSKAGNMFSIIATIVSIVVVIALFFFLFQQMQGGGGGGKVMNFGKSKDDLVVKADLAEQSPVRGCMVIKPYGYAIWEKMQRQLDDMFKETGHVNAYFPLLIPKSYLSREAEHVEGFAKECAVVTHYRLKNAEDGSGVIVDPAAKLEEELIIRPTSETIIWSTYKNWINSYRDLPILCNQWANVMRWEMRTRLFLRTAEFLWQEGHTAHATREEAEAEAQKMLHVYGDFAEKYMAVPVIKGVKSANERFAGALDTYTIEGLMQDGKALQCGTSHFLGQNFAKAFNVQFVDKNNKLDYVWATSWGVSTRLMGALIMTHSDDNGLVLPPHLAPIQVVIVPIYKNDEMLKKIDAKVEGIVNKLKAMGISVKYDNADNKRPGFKFADYELKGVPVRLVMGGRDLENNTMEVMRRDTLEKETRSCDGIEEYVQQLLEDIQNNIYQKALNYRNEHIVKVDSYDDFKEQIEKGGFILAHWDGTPETEDRIKEETKATIRCLPFDADEESLTPGKCMVTGKPSARRVLFARAY